MKKIILSLVVGFALIGIASVVLASGIQVGICHKSGQQWIYKLVNENSLNGHYAHGDFNYLGRPDVYDYEMDDWCNINANPQK